jgi:hypothetical protein
MVEVRVWDLNQYERNQFINTHKSMSLKSLGFMNKDRVLVGWYTKNNLRVAFYHNPTFFEKQKMYWLYGWSWESNGKT